MSAETITEKSITETTCSYCDCDDHLIDDCGWLDSKNLEGLTQTEISAFNEFDLLLERWREKEKKKSDIADQQSEICERINFAFAAVVKEQQLLAGLPWETEIYARTVNIYCHIKDTGVMEFLDKLEWENGRYDYHHSLKLGKHYIRSNDGVLEIGFEEMDDLVAFCKEQGIKPVSTTLNDQRDKANSEVERLTQIIERLK